MACFYRHFKPIQRLFLAYFFAGIQDKLNQESEPVEFREEQYPLRTRYWSGKGRLFFLYFY